MCKEIGADYIYINVSDKGGVDTLRDDINGFASTMAFNGSVKIVIMDEFDGASPNLQKAMRAAIEEFNEVCRFIFTCNNIAQVIEPIRSRCEVLHFSWSDSKSKTEMVPKIYKRLCNILKVENITYDPVVIEKIIEMKYPDIRSCIVALEHYSAMHNGVINNDILSFASVDPEFYNLILNRHVTAARQYIVDKELDISDLFTALYENYVPMLQDPNKKGQTIILIADYMFKHSFAIDKSINFAALLVELCGI